MKGLQRSIINAFFLLVILAPYYYYVYFRWIITLGFTSFIRQSPPRYILSFVVQSSCVLYALVNFYKHAILPLCEILYKKGVVDKTVHINMLRVDYSPMFLPWTYKTWMKVDNEKNIVIYPGTDDIFCAGKKVHMVYLRRSRLCIKVYMDTLDT